MSPAAVAGERPPRDAIRRILHCDMDCFYAAIHMRDDPSLRGKPVVIGGSPQGRGVVAAASYEARRFGIHSAQPSTRAARLCPDAVFIKPEFARYRRESTEVLAIFRRITPVVQPVSIDEAYLDVSGHLSPWGSAAAIAEEIRARVRQERGLAVSIGVGPSKLVAKIASDQAKPDGLAVVRPNRVQAFLAPLPVRCLPGVGPASERRLRQLGIETILDLRAMAMPKLIELFGKHGQWLFSSARGVDERPVQVDRERKSLSCERTYSKDIGDLREMDQQMDLLARRVSEGLKRKSLSACTITTKVRYQDFTTLARSHTLPAPTSDAAVIADWAKTLLRRTEAPHRQVRLLGVGAANLVRGDIAQLELFSQVLRTP